MPNAERVVERLDSGEISVRVVAASAWTDLPLSRLSWRELPDVPPPTLLKAVSDRLKGEEQTLVCLRCGFTRTTTAARYDSEGGSGCRLCHGSLSAVLSPRRTEEIERLVRYAKGKWTKSKKVPSRRPRAPRAPSEGLPPLVRQGYTSAELLVHYGTRALLALAGRGIGPDTARRLLARPYRSDADLVTEILKAERSYAKTRAFWE